MTNKKFSALESGLFDSTMLKTEQLRVVTGGATSYEVWKNKVMTASGGDSINTTSGWTTYTSGGATGDGQNDRAVM
ncbi:MAG: hypothetical protein KA165_07810 [Saprospiraceae bacterium]|nr:hypothetical protein [Saprospiraceae bacterium]